MKEVARAYLTFSLEKTDVTPGRLRLRVPAKRTNSRFFKEISSRIGTIDGVMEVRSNPKTSSLLIVHDDECDAILVRMNQLGIVKLVPRHQLAREEHAIHLSEKERATLRFLAFSSLAFYQAWHGKLLAASSALVAEAQEYWAQIPAAVAMDASLSAGSEAK
jgi:hypothetical protein